MTENQQSEKLRQDGMAIWNAGLKAVRSDLLLARHVACSEGELKIGALTFPLNDVDRICVVGGGKAGAGMAQGFESSLLPRWLDKVEGWLNVPSGCVVELQKTTLHAARLAGCNEPTEAGIAGSRRMIEMVSALSDSDLCVCLISGGGSALMPLPADDISLDDKLAVTRQLSAAGANIQQLNAVRKRISDFKGGGLARACRAGKLVTLIISDVIGDPLDVIASGPTVVTADGLDPLDVLNDFPIENSVRQKIIKHIQSSTADYDNPTCDIHNLVLGNNQTAVDAAHQEATRLGYRVEILPTEASNITAESVGRSFLRTCISEESKRPTCFISGGEPIVELAPAELRGKGGRNQQLVLAALDELLRAGRRQELKRIFLLSGGTDGEDGPTDAAGAFIGPATGDRLGKSDSLKPDEFLRRNDAYSFFQQTNGLFVTGPTHTNVCDLRVGLVMSRR